jgi:chromosomal replication initiator protein
MGAKIVMYVATKRNEAIAGAQINTKWQKITQALKSEFGDDVYKSWLGHLHFVKDTGNEIILEAPTRFIREWILTNYLDRIKQLWYLESPSIYSVEIIVNKSRGLRELAVNNNIIASGIDVSGQNVNIIGVNSSEPSMGSPIDRRFTFDNYVVGQSNKLAYTASLSVAENTEVIPGNNPLFLHGGVGLGKTHLMHAIALKIQNDQPNRKVLYLSAEKFMYQFVKSLRGNSVMDFKDSFRTVDILMIDDVQFICGKESTQEEFFHTVNSLLDMNKQIVISGDRSPSDLDGMKERVKSRLGWGMVADIKNTDFELRLGILRNKIINIKTAFVPDQVLEFLAGKIRSNVRELEGALNKVIAHSSLMDKKITLQYTQEILADLLRANEKTITIADIQKNVTSYFNIKISDMSSAKRARSVARPRQIAMYLCKLLTVRSLSEIGRKFGGKDHTTVMHAVKKVDQLMNEDSEFKKDVDNLINIINC